MAILYAVVARDTTVLAEFSAVMGNTGAIVRRILEKVPPEAESRLCFSQDHYIFHILRSDSLTFLCMANDALGRRIPFSYLEDIHKRFMKNYGRVAPNAPAYAMNDEFSRILHQQMEFFSSADTLNRVRGEVSEVHTIMVDNIEKILKRGEKLELLVDKTATMQDSAFHFKKQSRRLHYALWKKNVKLLMPFNPKVPWQGFADLLGFSIFVHDSRYFLWRDHSFIMQILNFFLEKLGDGTIDPHLDERIKSLFYLRSLSPLSTLVSSMYPKTLKLLQ